MKDRCTPQPGSSESVNRADGKAQTGRSAAGAGGCLVGVAEAVASADPLEEPAAPERPVELEWGRIDPFHWLRERSQPEVRRYLEEENRYLERVLAPWSGFQAQLERELRAWVPREDRTPPWRWGPYLYYRRFPEGAEYPLICRRPAADPRGAEEVLLDANELGAGSAFFHLSRFEPSLSGRFLAYAVDCQGRRLYTLRILDTATRTHLADVVGPTTGEFEWDDEETGLFYLQQNSETLRSEQLRYHRLGTSSSEDSLLYVEQDPTFSLTLTRSASREYLIVTSRQTLTTECRWFRPQFPVGALVPVLPRQRGLEYFLEHGQRCGHEELLILLNDRGRNFRLVAAPAATVADRGTWRELVPCREDVFLVDVRPYQKGLAVLERTQGLPRIRVLDAEGREQRVLSFAEDAYVLELDAHGDFEGRLRFSYSSLATPWTVYEEDFRTGERLECYREPVGGGYDPRALRTERLLIPVRDGTEVPATLCYRADLLDFQQAPLLLEGYGAYGLSLDPIFDSSLLSLLTRGWIFALAHVRGGQELGRSWYEQGRGQNKRHTFEDFVDVTEGLVARGYGARDRLFALGGSAGGLLVSVVANERPELFRGIIASVPFVDVLTTMSDPSIPLTTAEYDEWGDPANPDERAYLLSYSPYDNVRSQAYPHLLVTAGFHDSQVQYWEPAKWVAKLRKLRSDRSKWLLLRTDFEAGHSGTSGRYRRLAQRALEWTFLLVLAGQVPRDSEAGRHSEAMSTRLD